MKFTITTLALAAIAVPGTCLASPPQIVAGPPPSGPAVYGGNAGSGLSPAEQRARAEHSSDLSSLVQSGDKLLKDNLTQEAFTAYRQAANLWLKGDSDEVFARLGDAYAKLGQYPKAAEQYDRCWHSYGGPEMRFGAGRLSDPFKYALYLERAGRVAEALRMFQQSMGCVDMHEGLEGVSVTRNVHVNPDHLYTDEFEFALNIALAVSLHKNAEDALDILPYLKEAARWKPSSGLPYFYMGSVLHGANAVTVKKYGTPEAMFRMAAKLGTSDVKQKASESLVRWGYDRMPTKP